MLDIKDMLDLEHKFIELQDEIIIQQSAGDLKKCRELSMVLTKLEEAGLWFKKYKLMKHTFKTDK